MRDTIDNVQVHLVSMPVPGQLADATRKVDKLGYLIVRITTKSGIEGIGVTYNEVGGEGTCAVVQKAIAPRLIGRDPLETEAIWTEMFHYLRGVGRKGMTFCALSAVDAALWDIKGKAFDVPIYRLLGGNRTEIPVYASGGWASYSDEELVAEMTDMVSQGYTAIKFKLGVEGGRNPNRDVTRVRKVREAVGPDIDLLLDANNCWDAATAVQVANRVKEYNIYLFEEPVFADDLPGLARFKQGTDIPLATGEHEYTKFGLRDLLLNDAVDIVQLDGARAGGYTEMVKIAAMTEAWNLKFAPHAMENLHLQLAGAMGSIVFLERLRIFEEITGQVFKDAPVPVNGVMTIPDLPGLGLALDMDFIKDNDEAG